MGFFLSNIPPYGIGYFSICVPCFQPIDFFDQSTLYVQYMYFLYF